VVVVAEGNDAPSFGLYHALRCDKHAANFMEKGPDALIVYDDLTQHAGAYRELSWLLRSHPPRSVPRQHLLRSVSGHTKELSAQSFRS